MPHPSLNSQFGTAAGAIDGAKIFEDNCAVCHGPDADWPIAARVAGKTRAEIHDRVGRLPELNEMMPPFEGSDAERAALEDYLAGVAARGGK